MSRRLRQRQETQCRGREVVGTCGHREEGRDPQRVAELLTRRKRADAIPTSPAAQWLQTHEHRTPRITPTITWDDSLFLIPKAPIIVPNGDITNVPSYHWEIIRLPSCVVLVGLSVRVLCQSEKPSAPDHRCGPETHIWPMGTSCSLQNS